MSDWERFKAAPLWEKARALALILIGDGLFVAYGWLWAVM